MIDDVRKGANEDEFRELNERLEHRALQRISPGEAFEIVCECDREECTARIRIRVSDYESIRTGSTVFIVMPGHADPTCERVVSSTGAYDVVEKFGVAGHVAKQEDPRKKQRRAE